MSRKLVLRRKKTDLKGNRIYHNYRLHLDLTVDLIHRFYLDQQRVGDHRSLVIGIRELNMTEQDQYCQANVSLKTLPKFDRPFHFTSNYALRTYLSGCYYLDEKNQWRSDGLLVSLIFNFCISSC